jgi:hypothetical protein
MNAEQRTPNEYVLLQVNMQMRGIIQYNSEQAFRIPAKSLLNMSAIGDL